MSANKEKVENNFHNSAFWKQKQLLMRALEEAGIEKEYLEDQIHVLDYAMTPQQFQNLVRKLKDEFVGKKDQYAFGIASAETVEAAVIRLTGQAKEASEWMHKADVRRIDNRRISRKDRIQTWTMLAGLALVSGCVGAAIMFFSLRGLH